jgi:hypothetical protein
MEKRERAQAQRIESERRHKMPGVIKIVKECATCADVRTHPNTSGVAVYRCHKDPPVVAAHPVAPSDSPGVFPPVLPTDWCSRWVKKGKG